MNLLYPVVKLLDYAERQAELETSDNPFALAVLAHLKTLETRGDAEARFTWKLRLATMARTMPPILRRAGARRSNR